MAKSKGPLFSLSASGSMSPCLTFSERKTGSQVRFQRKQKVKIPSWKQTDNQSMYRVIYARWLSFSVAEKKVYDDEVKAKNLSMSGWNYFLKLAMLDPKIYLGLVGYWSFNESGKGTVADLSKNGNVGTLKPSWPSNSPQYVASKNVKMRKALSFDGIDDYVDCGNDSSLDLTGEITIMAWAKADTFTNFPTIIARGYGGDGSYTLGFYQNTRKLQLWLDSKQLYNLDYADLDTNWHHIAVTAKTGPNNVKIYVDGQLYGTFTTTQDLVGTNAYNVAIGRNNKDASYYFDGLIDEVRIYNRALSSGEILLHYNNSKHRFYDTGKMSILGEIDET